jgi:hypothetical protein
LQLTTEWYRQNLSFFETKMSRALAVSQGR